MVEEIKMRVAGVWQTATEVFAKVSGTWKDVQQVQVRNGGVWQTVFQQEVWTLTGTSGIPNEATDFDIDPGEVLAGFQFRVDGTVYKQHNGSLTQFAAGTQFSNLQTSPEADLWIKATLNVGTAPNFGSGLGTWFKIVGSGAGQHQWLWHRTTIGQYLNDSVKIELSTDSGGSTIVATGYYGIDEVSIEP